MRLAAHLWTDEPPPPQYIRLIFCRDVYHCTPDMLGKLPVKILIEDMAMLNIENQVKKSRAS
jgi:hypothetical protein